MEKSFVHKTASIGDGVIIGSGSKIWGFAEVRDGARIGGNSGIGRGAYIGRGVIIGSNCKIQNLAQIFEPAVVADGVFIGPGAILTNDKFPRAVNPDLTVKSANDWVPTGVIVGEGAAIGAGAICIAPVQIGAWALVAAGAVVTKEVKPHSHVQGSPARHVGWIGPAGFPLVPKKNHFQCPKTGAIFLEIDSELHEQDR